MEGALGRDGGIDRALSGAWPAQAVYVGRAADQEQVDLRQVHHGGPGGGNEDDLGRGQATPDRLRDETGVALHQFVDDQGAHETSRGNVVSG